MATSVMPMKAKAYLAATIFTGAAVLLHGIRTFSSEDTLRFAFYLGLAGLSSAMKVSLPGIAGTMSVNFLFVLISIATLNLPETLLIACTATLMQCVWRSKTKPNLVRVAFNISNVSTAILIADFVYHWEWLRAEGIASPLLLAAAATVYFVTNTFPVATVICLTEGKMLGKVWKECYFWSFPYYLVGAGVAALVGAVNGVIGWQASLLTLPLIYMVFRSYRQYLTRLEDEKKHAQEMAGLHLRTIQALALAIEAKDFTTHSHLQRVATYAHEVGKELGLNETELQALWAAALLHDIGKLAVPEHIISKPGKLTPAEFEKMKIHPVVGAEILEQVEFPYPVAPIVRAHHEKWDGTGYPFGLEGEEIPLGARILSAVDCLDALASDRQYRRALPLDEAIAYVVGMAGTSYDPRVVEVLQRRYVELERMVQGGSNGNTKLTRNPRTGNQTQPATGFATPVNAVSGAKKPEFLNSIAAARQEAHQLFELTHELGNSLNLTETLSVLSLRLKRLCPYDGIAIYVRRGETLYPEYVSGQDCGLFSSLEIPMGEGLSGWVAQNKQAIVNGNPSVEPGYLCDPHRFSTLQSTLAVPLEGLSGVIGTIALYHSQREAFKTDHLRILTAVSSKLALAIENAVKYRDAENSATTDGLTGLPNARSLFLHLDAELARCKRTGAPLTVLVCDLDGFKQVNDRFGHLEGNRVLRVVAQGIKESCREYDYAARMGGDEFVLVLPGHEGDVDSTIRRLNEVAVNAGWELFGERILAISVGKATYPQDGVDVEELLAKGDHRMYKMKEETKARASEERARNVVTMPVSRPAGFVREQVAALGD